LQVGDIVTAISGRPVGRSNLRRRLMQIGAGETVDVTVIREDECFTLPVTLGEQPDRR
jgi:S1-C subfamily serine protease